MNNSQRRNDLVSRYDNIIESYRPDLTGDDTIKIIRSFRRFLSEEGQTNLMLDVSAIGGDRKKLQQLAKHLEDAVLKSVHLAGKVPFSIANTPNPNATTTTSRPRIPAQLEQQIPQRDGYKCAFTGNYDRDTVNHGHVLLPDEAYSSFTRITPIISFALGNPTQAYEDEMCRKDAVGKIWSSLFRYFPFLQGKINHDSLDQYQNLVTFDVAVQEHFETRTIAFQPSAEGPNQYDLHKFPADSSLPSSWSENRMALVSSDTSIPLPDPDFFAVHYQIARILEESGIGAEIRDHSSHDHANLNPNNSRHTHLTVQRGY